MTYAKHQQQYKRLQPFLVLVTVYLGLPTYQYRRYYDCDAYFGVAIVLALDTSALSHTFLSSPFDAHAGVRFEHGHCPLSHHPAS